jgi:hypothetical protein
MTLPSGSTVAASPATGDRTTLLATMAKFADEFAASKTAEGYQKLPSGLIIQWGQVGSIAGNGNATMTYPMAFPNACFSVVAIAGANNIGQPAISGVNASISNKTGFIAYNTSASLATQPGLCIAIGH